MGHHSFSHAVSQDYRGLGECVTRGLGLNVFLNNQFLSGPSFVLHARLSGKGLFEESVPAVLQATSAHIFGDTTRTETHTPYPIFSAALVSLLHFIKAESSDNYFHNELALQINANYTMQS